MMMSVTGSPMQNGTFKRRPAPHRRVRNAGSDGVTTLPRQEGPTTLDFALRNLDAYDASDNEKRRFCLETLEKILAQWTKQLADSSNPWQCARVSLVTFGSYRLGVHRKTSDIDVLAVAPPSCSRKEFFSSLVTLLRAQAEEVHPIPGAYTPVIKFRLHGLCVDMLFARVADDRRLLQFQRSRVSPLVGNKTMAPSGPRVEYCIVDADLAELDEAGVRSMNGSRVSQMLLHMVPHYGNFQSVLKAVKEWAVQAGIYSNVLGFWGGINYAILVAHVCIKNPRASNTRLLNIFFNQFAAWEWPNPVHLLPPQTTPPAGTPSLATWDPAGNPRDRHHVCPIITPAYPSMNSSYNVGYPQLRRIQDELVRASNYLHRHNYDDFDGLFRQSDFFTRHEHFLRVTIKASSQQEYVEWFRFVESKLRLLICNIETTDINAWPFVRFFEGEEHETFFFIALRFAEHVKSVNIYHCTSDFMHKVNSWKDRKPTMTVTMTHIRSAHLPAFVFPDEKVAATAGGDEQNVEPPANQASTTTFASPPKRCRMMSKKVAPAS